MHTIGGYLPRITRGFLMDLFINSFKIAFLIKRWTFLYDAKLSTKKRRADGVNPRFFRMVKKMLLQFCKKQV